MKIIRAHNFPLGIIAEREMKETLEYLVGVLKAAGQSGLTMAVSDAGFGVVTMTTENGGTAVISLED